MSKDSPEYIAQMVAVADGKPAAPVVDPEADPVVEPVVEGETKLYAGKYKTVEEMEAGYTELNKRFSSGERATSETVVEPVVDPDAVVDPNALPVKDADPVVDPDAAPQIDFAKYSKSITETGALTEDDYTELAGKGLPKEIVDAYVDGLKSQANTRTESVVKALGGQEQFDAVRTFASTQLTEAEYNAVNSQLAAAKSTEEVSLVYQTLNTRFKAANPAEPTLVSGQPSATTSGYGSQAEVTAAMSDPLYAKDPAYRKRVAAKMAVSKF